MHIIAGFSKFLESFHSCILCVVFQVVPFVAFIRGKKVIMTIVQVSDSISIPQEVLVVMKRFHLYILIHILGYNIQPHTTGCFDHGCLWTVLRKENSQYSIDYDFLETNEFPRNGYRLEQLDIIDLMKHVPMTDSVVLPVHRNSNNLAYYVESVAGDISVDDPFPNVKIASTYIEYFKKKYDVDLAAGQPMLELCCVHKNLNFLHQRWHAQTDSPVKAKKNIYLPAQLCALHPIPKHLWQQIVAIPALLYRLSSSLLIFELQVELFKSMELLCPVDEEDLFINISKKGVSLASIQQGACAVTHNVATVESSQTEADFKLETVKYLEGCAVATCSNIPNKGVANGTRLDMSSGMQKTCWEGHRNYINEINDGALGPILRMSTSPTELFTNKPPSYLKIKNTPPNVTKVAAGQCSVNANAIHSCSQIGPALPLLFAALTTAQANYTFHHEQLEFLGDAFLNAFVLVESFHHYSTANENVLSKQKSADVSNLSLFEKGQRKHLFRYVVDEMFDFKSNPMLLGVLGCEGADFSGTSHRLKNCRGNSIERDSSSCTAPDQQHVADSLSSCVLIAVRKKAIADSVEALIGLFYLFNGQEVALKLMKWIGFEVCCVPQNNVDGFNERGCCGDNPEATHIETDGFNDRGCCGDNPEATHIETSIGTRAGNGQGFLGLPCQDEGLQCRANASTCSSNVEDSSERTHACKTACQCCSVAGKQSTLKGSVLEDSETLKLRHTIQESSYCTSVSSSSYNPGGSVSIQCSLNSTRLHICAEFAADEKHCLPSCLVRQLAKFENQIGYEFKNKKLLYEALLHPSYPRKLSCDTYCNQRLELLGDSLITLLVTEHLCRAHPTATNAELTVMRSLVVSRHSFAAAAVLNHYHKYLLFVSADLACSIESFVMEIREKKASGRLWTSVSLNYLGVLFLECYVGSFCSCLIAADFT